MRRRRTPDPLIAGVLRAAGSSSPLVAYLGSASDDDPDFFRWCRDRLRTCGAGRVELAATASPGADLEETRRILEEAEVIFVGGGDVEAGMEVLRERRLLGLLGRRYRAGAVFFGASAGSIMLARQWVRWREPADDATAETFACLGFAPLWCDTHGEAEGWEELRALVRLLEPAAVAYGIPTSGALRVGPDGGVEALAGPVQRFARRGGAAVRMADLRPR